MCHDSRISRERTGVRKPRFCRSIRVRGEKGRREPARPTDQTPAESKRPRARCFRRRARYDSTSYLVISRRLRFRISAWAPPLEGATLPSHRKALCMARHRSIVALALPLVLLLLVAALGGGCGPMAASSLAEQGLRKARAGKYDKALATCEEALQLNPRDYRAYNSRGTTYYLRNGAGDFDRAIADFGEAIRLAPTNADAYYNRALVYRDRGDGERAEADETKARDLDVEMKETYAQLPAITPPAARPRPARPRSTARPTRTSRSRPARKSKSTRSSCVCAISGGRRKSRSRRPLAAGLACPPDRRRAVPLDNPRRALATLIPIRIPATRRTLRLARGVRCRRRACRAKGSPCRCRRRRWVAADSSAPTTRRPRRDCPATWPRRRTPRSAPVPPRFACLRCRAASTGPTRARRPACDVLSRLRSLSISRGRRASRAERSRATGRGSPRRSIRAIRGPIRACSRGE